MLNGKKNGVKFINISPLKTDAPSFIKAKQIFIRPNTDTALMLGLAHTLHEEGLSDKVTYRTPLHHQVKEIYIVPKRNDISQRNQWLNFTNLDDDTETNYTDYQNNFYRMSILESININDNAKSPIYYLGSFTTDNALTDLKIVNNDWSTSNDVLIEGKHCYQKQDIINFLNIWKYRDYANIPYIGRDNYKFYTSNIIEDVEIFYDQVERVAKRENTYFTKVQPYMSGLNTNLEEVLLYSFSLEPYNYQPSGKCNFSHIKEVIFNITLKDTSILPENYTYKYDLNIYSKYYNILEIRSGTGRLLFRN